LSAPLLCSWAHSILLLVTHARGNCASRVKPIQGFLFSGPTDRECGRGKWVQRFMKTCALLAGLFHHADQHLWTQAPINRDSFAIEAIYEGDQILRRTYVHLLDVASVA